MWLVLGLISAVLLGVYDILNKVSLQENAVIPVLFFSILTGALIFIPLLILSKINPDASLYFWYIPDVPAQSHLFFMLKSLIVGSQWILSYFAIKNLPLTIVSPIRSSAPLWTLIGAIVIFGERLSTWQWVGLSITILFYYLFSLAGLKEGISFRKNKWALFMTIATIIGSISSLYDKYLVHHFNRMAMQAWFEIYLVPLSGIVLLLFWFPKRKSTTPFKWRHSIPFIAMALVTADFFYFQGLAYPDALISIMSTLRRGSVIITFTIGAFMFHEKNIKLKAIILCGILAGICLIMLKGN